MSKTLSNSDIADLLATLATYPFYVTFTPSGTGATPVDLGPLAGPPSITPETETKDVTLYETGAAVQKRLLIKNDMKVTVNTQNMDGGMEIIGALAKNDDLLNVSKEGTLLLEPITSDATAKSITFPHACVDIDNAINPGENGDPNAVQVAFYCKADATSGKPFTYAAASTSP